MGSKKVQNHQKNGKKTQDVFAGIKADLEKQKADLLAEAGITIGSSLNPRGESFPDLSDQASAEADQNFILRLREREQKLIKKIDEALERIENGEYGICEKCEEPISEKRLKARPVTTYCIDCKTEQEEQENNRK